MQCKNNDFEIGETKCRKVSTYMKV